MKKLLLILMVFAAGSAAALNLRIVNASFTATDTVPFSSVQYVDVQFVSGSYVPSDRLKLYIEHVNDNGSLSNLRLIYSAKFDSLWLPMPLNADGISKRIVFTMPADYIAGKFKINVNLAPSTYFGIFPAAADTTSDTTTNPVDTTNIPTSIRNNTTKTQIVSVEYYGMNGIQLAEPKDLYIRRTIYSDGSFESRKIQIIE